jgi:cellobiose phosphorylase
MNESDGLPLIGGGDWNDAMNRVALDDAAGQHIVVHMGE